MFMAPVSVGSDWVWRVRGFAALCSASSLLWLVGCSDAAMPPPSPAAKKPQVLTSFYPTLYFTQRIAGDGVEVACPLPDDADPIFWKPDAAALARLQGADLVILNGAEFEKWVAAVSLPASRVVSTAASFRDQWLEYENAVTHQHGPEGEHSHEGVDGHTWLDPWLAMAQAEAVRDALKVANPESAASFDRGFAELKRDLEQLDRDLKELLPATPSPILCSHPAYNYLARRYGWKIHNLDLDPEAAPAPATVEEIRGVLTKFPAKVLLWESDPTSATVETFHRELGLTSVVFSPCELLGNDALRAGNDYLSVMRENIGRLRRALSAP